MDYHKQYNEYKEAVDAYLDTLFMDKTNYEIIYDSIRYSLLSGGKRIRAVMTLEFSRLGGIDWNLAVPYACALEMVHTYSLIHDDLPCMDDDDLRRGQLTNHKVYGETLAVLAGDALQPEAIKLMANAPQLSVSNRLEAINVLTNACGVDGMVAGQVLDTVYDVQDKDGLLELNLKKTGCMIMAAAELGCVAGGITGEKREQAINFAKYLGLAFQVEDDLLDVLGTEEEFGKPIGSDKEQEKVTFVDVLGIEDCKKFVKDYTNLALKEIEDWENNEFLIEFAKSMVNRKY